MRSVQAPSFPLHAASNAHLQRKFEWERTSPSNSRQCSTWPGEHMNVEFRREKVQPTSSSRQTRAKKFANTSSVHQLTFFDKSGTTVFFQFIRTFPLSFCTLLLVVLCKFMMFHKFFQVRCIARDSAFSAPFLPRESGFSA